MIALARPQAGPVRSRDDNREALPGRGCSAWRATELGFVWAVVRRLDDVRQAMAAIGIEIRMKETNNERQYAPKVLLCRLIERASPNGNKYFTGYLGEAKVILLADKEADPEKLYGGIAAWKLLVEERKPKPEGRGK